jgi:hypothetical protein
MARNTIDTELDHAQAHTRALQAQCDAALRQYLDLQRQLEQARRAEERARQLDKWEQTRARLARAENAYCRHLKRGNTQLAANAKLKMYELMDELGIQH